MRVSFRSPPKNGEIVCWLATNGSIPYILVSTGSESIFTDITEYIFFRLRETSRELKYKEKERKWVECCTICFDYWTFSFLSNTFYYTSAVHGQPECEISILGRCMSRLLDKKKFIVTTCLSAQIPHASKYHERRGCHDTRASRARLFFKRERLFLSLEKVFFFIRERLFFA